MSPSLRHSLHGRQVAEDDVYGVDRVGADGLLQLCRLSSSLSSQHVVEHVPADQRHKLDGDLKGAVLPAVTRQRHVQIHLRSRRRMRRRRKRRRAGPEWSRLTPPEATGSAFTV